MLVNHVVALVLGTAGFLIAFGVIWKMARYAFRLDRAMPVLLAIAEEFAHNGGNSLRDQIDKVNTTLTAQNAGTASIAQELGIQTRLAVEIAEDSRLIAQTNSTIVNELSMAQTDDIHHIKEYLHEQMHGMNNNFGKITLQYAIIEKRYERLESRLDGLVPFIQRHREDYREGGEQT